MQKYKLEEIGSMSLQKKFMMLKEMNGGRKWII